jgi:hypothetical protein
MPKKPDTEKNSATESPNRSTLDLKKFQSTKSNFVNRKRQQIERHQMYFNTNYDGNPK